MKTFENPSYPLYLYETFGKTFEKPSENLRKTFGKPSENLRMNFVYIKTLETPSEDPYSHLIYINKSMIYKS